MGLRNWIRRVQGVTRVEARIAAVESRAEVVQRQNDALRDQLTELSELLHRVDGRVEVAALDLRSRLRYLALASIADEEVADRELRIFSQNGEDGVLAAIHRRIGVGERFFVEFGAETGREANCVLLADVHGWAGLFMEADPDKYRELEEKYTNSQLVQTRLTMVTPDNIEELLAAAGTPEEFGVLSIDVDGQDYWLWKALDRYHPRVVVIEYNSALPAGAKLVQPDEPIVWDKTNYGGASLGALVALAEKKGYRLAHLELTGTNAFFVRTDLADGLTGQPVLRSPNHWLESSGHPPDPLHRPYVDLDVDRSGPQDAGPEPGT
jgi:hypothetical protein